jgi:hypothetical protein
VAGTQAALPPARLLILTAHNRCGVAIIRDSRCRLKRRFTRRSPRTLRSRASQGFPKLRNWGPKPVRTLEYSHALWHTRRVTVA